MDVGGVCGNDFQVNCQVSLSFEDSEEITLKMFLFKSAWRKESIIREMTRGPFGNPALMRNDPLR